MGLARDIENAFLDSVDKKEEDLDNVNNQHMRKLSEGLSKAIQDFLTAQTFTITKMKAVLEVEELATAAPLQADVLRSVQSLGGNAGGPVQSVVTQGTKGVLIPSLNLKRFGGQGGVMKTKGFAYIGNNPVDPGQTNENLTKVKLLKQNIVKG